MPWLGEVPEHWESGVREMAIRERWIASARCMKKRYLLPSMALCTLREEPIEFDGFTESLQGDWLPARSSRGDLVIHAMRRLRRCESECR